MGKRRVNKRVLIIASPARGSYGLAEAYAEAAALRGHQVRLLRLDRLRFDPILHLGYAQEQPLEPDLQGAQAHIAWGGVPALLKGFLERVMLPGFAFRYERGRKYPTPLPTGRTAQLLLTMDTPPWYFRWGYWAPGLFQMKKATLGFCGIAPVRCMMIGALRDADQALRERWLDSVRKLAGAIWRYGDMAIARRANADTCMTSRAQAACPHVELWKNPNALNPRRRKSAKYFSRGARDNSYSPFARASLARDLAIWPAEVFSTPFSDR